MTREQKRKMVEDGVKEMMKNEKLKRQKESHWKSIDTAQKMEERS